MIGWQSDPPFLHKPTIRDIGKNAGNTYQKNPVWQLANMPLLAIIFAMDAFDGYVARKRNETSLFGAIFDITIDRVVENVLWIVLVDLDFIPVWVAIVFVTRSFLVDSVRTQAASEGQTPFGMMRSPIGQFIVNKEKERWQKKRLVL